MMLGTKKKLVPELRFPEFEADWKEKMLGKVARFSKGKGISKNEITEDGQYSCIRYGELYTTYGVLIKKAISRTNSPRNELVFSEGGEVIIPASGETAIDIATASVVIEKGVALGSDLNIIKSKFDGVFLAYYLNNKRKLEIAKLAQGNSVVHLYASQLSSMSVFEPKLEEQQKISEFLSSVDDKLTNLRRKWELLENYKRGLMQQLFSQQIRFKKNDGTDFPDWEEKSLDILAERVIVKNVDDFISVVLTNSAIRGVVNQQDYFDKDIANTNNLEGYYVVDQGDYVYNPRISVHAPVGPIKKNKVGKGLMSPLYTIFRFKNEENTFYEQYFNTNLWHRYMSNVANYGARHDRMNISMTDFMNMPLPFPHPDEQEKIVSFLLSLDKKIDFVNKKIIQIDIFKKGLLNKMFV